MFNEEFIYNSCKEFLIKNGFSLLAGDPPRGTDPFLPFIEIKGENNGDKGSKNSYKPDLVAWKNNSIYIVECKPKYNESDYFKLQEILSNEQRKQELYKSFLEKQIFSKNNIEIDFQNFSCSLTAFLCYSGKPNLISNLFPHIIITNFGEGFFINE